MKNWNRTGKIKSLVILILCIISLILVDFNNEKTELKNDFHIIMIILNSLYVVLFFPLSAKFWSLFGNKFDKPKWNENPITFKSSKIFNFFQFIAFWFICQGFIHVLLVGLFLQRFDGENAQTLFGGISLLIGIKLSLKWLDKSGNTKEKTVANKA